MASRSRTALALAAALFAAPDAVRAADLTIVWNVTTPRGGARTQTHYLSSTRIRATGERRDVVVDAASGRVVLVDHRREEYSETTLDDVAAFLRQMEAALASGSAVEKAIGPLGPVKVQKGTRRRTIAGHECEPYTLTMGDSIRFEVWMAPALAAPAQFFEARRVVYAMLGPIGTRFAGVLDEVRKIAGFPLAITVEYRMRMSPREVVTEAQEVRPGSIPEATFAVPPGYRKVEPPFGRHRRG